MFLSREKKVFSLLRRNTRKTSRFRQTPTLVPHGRLSGLLFLENSLKNLNCVGSRERNFRLFPVMKFEADRSARPPSHVQIILFDHRADLVITYNWT